MKSISHTSRARDKILHIETDLGIINIRVGLTNLEGYPVESIEIIPDETYNKAVVNPEDTVNNIRLIGKEKELQ